MAALLPLGLLSVVTATATPAFAASESGLITISPATPAPQPSGSPTTYSVAVSCSGAISGLPCGGSTGATVTIPLTGTNTTPANMSTWAYSAVSGTPLLITSGPTVVSNGSGGFNLVMNLSSTLFVAGYSGTITLQVTPPNNITPNHTTWTLAPVLAGGNITSVTVPTPATGEATAAPLPVITKFTDDGGSVYVAGSQVTYDITTACNTSGVGNLFMTSGSLSDPLPAGLTFVSATGGGVYNAGTDTVTWTYPTGTSTPAGCAAGSTGATSYQIVAGVPNPLPTSPPLAQPLKNIATFAGQGPDATASTGTISGATTAEADVDVVATPPNPTGPCNTAGCPTMSKSSLAPLAISSLPSNQYQGTYAGQWVTPSTSPTYTVGAASGSFQVRVNFPLTHTYQTQVVDPLPCLDNRSTNVYSSDSPTAAACAHPAFTTTIIQVSGPGLGAAATNGWVPTAILADNTTVNLTPTAAVGSSATSAYFTYTGADASPIATVSLPPTQYLEGDNITLTLWGYAAGSLLNLDQLVNTATTTPILNGTALGSNTASANLYILGSTDQLGVSKSFSALGGGLGNSTELNIKGSVSFPGTLNNDVVLTDLLPSGLTWSNIQTSGSFVLSQGAGASSSTVTGTIAYLTDYLGSGRNLIRATIPHADFTTGGYWTITPAANTFDLVTPTALGTYPNTDQIFLANYAPAQLDPTCTTPTQTGGGISPATFESYNPLDLAGDGHIQEDYCQNGATLVVQPSGAAFSLTKTVQGALDPAPKGALGIGDTTLGGLGTYVLNWSNVGNDTLATPVIYDILPYVGDTGVSQGQAGVARNSQFTPVFAGVGTLPTGVTVEYSQSTNPCRTQVYPSAPACVNDWTATPPTDPTTVKALEFLDTTDSYPAGSSFAVSFQVTVPNLTADANLVAWNSAATNATDVSNPANVPLPAEPPKVGLTAPTGGPTLTTNTSISSLAAYATTPLSDKVTIVGTSGHPGTLAWSLVGPIAPVSASCQGLTWAGAPVSASGTINTPAADGVVTVGPVAGVQGQGCYSWTETLTLANAGGTATSLAGAANELVQATPYPTTLATTAAPTFTTTTSTNSSTDSIVVSNSGIGIGNGAPTAATLSWDLYGPVTPITAGSCTGINWTLHTTPLDSGQFTVIGDGTYNTLPTNLTNLGTAGCYTYTDSLPGTTSGLGVATTAGSASETFILLPPPTTTTAANQATPNPRTSVSDAATITNTFGKGGNIGWQLYGPIPVPVGGCTAVLDWTTATPNPYRSGNQGFTGDQTARTVPSAGVTVGGVGCYSWAETVSGPNFFGTTSVAAGAAGEIFQVVPYQPALATTANPNYGGSANTAVDNITVSNSDLGSGGSAPASAPLTWTLYGPVPPTGGVCPGLGFPAWTTAAQVATNTIPAVNGTANQTQPATLTAIGCYTYTDSLAPATNGDTLGVATSTRGVPSETFQLISSQQVTTAANQATPNPRTSVSDAVTITGTGGFAGNIGWQLLGPIAVPTTGGCAAVTNWNTGTPYKTGTQTFTGDQTALTVPTGGTSVGAPGCYSWAETVTGPNFLGPTPVLAGATGEIFQVQVLQPNLTTTMSTSVTTGVESSTDSIVVAGTDIAPGNTTGAPTSGSVTWKLLGPVAPSGTACATVDWTAVSVPTAATGTIPVTGNGTLPVTAATPLSLASCYTYTATLAATTDSAAFTSAAGLVPETTQVPAAAAVSTTANQATPNPRTSVSDAVTITGTGGGTGSIAWQLLGPIAVPTTGGCAAVTNWNTGTPYNSGTQAFTGNQAAVQVPTGGISVGAPGCYSWAESVAGISYPGTTPVAAGATGEIFQVQVLQPNLTTTMSTSVTAGVESSTDSIVVAGTDIAPGNTTGAPTSGTVTWTLLGPVAPIAASCTGVSWGGALTVATGTIPVTGNGTLPVTAATPLTLASCYTYTATLAATTDSAAFTSSPGIGVETGQVPAAAAVSTTANQATPNPRTLVSDAVTITGTGGGTGSIAWQLLGPIAVPTTGGCAAVTNWNIATPYKTGTQTFTADQTALTVPTGGTSVGAPGCYSWAESVAGISYPGTTPVAAGATGEIFQVQVLQPTLTTTMSTSVTTGVESSTDSIVVAGTDIAPGNTTGAPTSGTVTWTLLGPVAPIAGACPSLATAWTGAAVVSTGTIPVTGNGTLPMTAATPLAALGNCYTYTATLAATTDSAVYTSPAGVTTETASVPAAPTVTSVTSSSLVYPHASVSDSVTISGIGVGNSGTLTWTLVGPVAPVSGSCATANWTGAPTTPVGQGTANFSADGTLTTGPVTVGGVGCYSWTDHVAGTFPGFTDLNAGAANEVVLVQPHQPLVSTTAVVTSGSAGTKSVVDNITVSASGIGTSTAAPQSAVMTWTLFGPVTPTAASCNGVSWTGAATVATGTLVVTGDAAYATPSTTLTAAGCYSYTESLAATVDSLVGTSAIGLVHETAVLLDPPTIATTTSSALVHPYTSVSDSATVAGTSGQPGTMVWSLVGPVATLGGTCTGVSWSNAPVVTTGHTAITADGKVTTGPSDVKAVGCYSWTDSFTGDGFVGQTVVAAGAANEVMVVTPYQPVLSTKATMANGAMVDAVTITQSGIGLDPASPASAVLTWSLMGPATATNGGCTTVTWTGQPVLATGTITVTKDGTYTTPSTKLGGPGCYTFGEKLAATAVSTLGTTDPGVALETAYLAPVTPAAAPSGAAPNGLGAIGTDLGRWLPGNAGVSAALAVGVGLLLAAALVLTRRRRRRQA
jgi:hypothetical protein